VLELGCIGQKKLKGNKCFEDYCFPITKVLSGNNHFGYVVIVDTDKGKYVVKWNIRKKDVNMKKEVKFQKEAHRLGLAPKIITYYRTKNNFYIYMENLADKGYKSISELYKKKVPVHVLKKIVKRLCKLHRNGIAHGDIHSENVFYNSKKKKIMFIDFGMSKHYKSEKLARKKENVYSEYESDPSSGIPENWYLLREYLDKLGGNCRSRRRSKK